MAIRSEKARQHAIQIFTAAIRAVQPATLLPQHLSVTNGILRLGGDFIPRSSFRNLYVIGAGKASAAMAVATEQVLGDLITDGLVTTKYGHSLPCERIRIQESAHPVPDENGVRAVEQTVALLRQATPDDLVICLISGGASALWCDVPPGLTLPDVQKTFDLLIKSGAAIDEINTVRKHLSAIKGGQLVRHCGGARIFSFLISDVTSDDLSVIASGPTVADASTFQDAHAILAAYGLIPQVPTPIRQHLENGLNGQIPETPKPGDALFDRATSTIIGSNRVAVQAAAQQAQSLGYQTHIVPEPITGDAVTEAQMLVRQAAQYQGAPPLCIIQGGETTVNVTGTGKGGRNQHFALAALNELAHLSPFPRPLTLLSGGTDGTDGPTDATGALVDTDTLTLVNQKNLSIDTYLSNQDAYHFFNQTDSLLITGPTQTNVMDLMLAIVT
ncbi:glycerate kinase [Spirosoma sp. KUDC1026]|uniref:glycerate kinase type-2 family protein n=1 Tax=Spirosoma sp. KUDC1026 TaxID=2745947 RepID=UPI00159BD2F2|nr:glycerate kinase [Spirosoma sp. KUDC1026]QKZ14820.1 glycerate kinase [Spirosoma sp. KUDC1026]